MDLFDALTPQGFNPTGQDEAGLARAPLAVRMRPASLDEVVGQAHLTAPGAPLRQLIAPTGEGQRVQPASVILWGPPGTGKTTLAYLVARQSDRAFTELSAVTAGVKDVREVIETARRRLAIEGKETVLFIDEVHRFNKAQQDALLPAVENRIVTLIAATTENPSFSVNSPLLSRSLLLTLQPLADADIQTLVERAVADVRGLGGAIQIADDALVQLVRMAGGDARKSLTILEAAAGAALDAAVSFAQDAVGDAADDAADEAADEAADDTVGDASDIAFTDAASDSAADSAADSAPVITLNTIEKAVDVLAVRYDRDGDQHYDVISAFIKSIRGSDPDAALHYLARMIAAGEDPKFIARRIVVHAAEDIGMADPSALQTAIAAAQAVQLIGLPEARIPLAEAVIHLATAPKSNAVVMAIDGALADVKAGKVGAVPLHLRDAHYAGAKALGHGKQYVYPHDVPGAVAAQQYLPDALADAQYYRPTQYGFERQVAERLARFQAIQRGE